MAITGIREQDGNYIVDGDYPPGSRLADISEVRGPQDRSVQHLKDLARHKSDLRFVQDAMRRLRDVPDDPEFVRMALWRSAVVTFWRCFDPKSRDLTLKKNRVFRHDVSRQLLDYFEMLRHNDAAHDASRFTAARLIAVIGPDESQKVLDAFTMSATTLPLEDDGVAKLSGLAEAAVEWVTREFDKRLRQVLQHLRERPYEELAALPRPTLKDAE